MTGLRDAQIASKTFFLGISVKVFQKRLAFQLAEWVKKTVLTNTGGHLPGWCKQNKKVEKGQICCLCLSWDIHLLPSDTNTPDPQAFGLKLELRPQPSWASSLQMADGGTSQPPVPWKPIPQNKSLYTCMYLFLFLFLGRTSIHGASRGRL